MKTYTKAVSATLAGALAVGMVPAMALADDSVEMMAQDVIGDAIEGSIVKYDTAKQATMIDAENNVFLVNSAKAGKYTALIPSDVKGKHDDDVYDSYKYLYFKLTTKDDENGTKSDEYAVEGLKINGKDFYYTDFFTASASNLSSLENLGIGSYAVFAYADVDNDGVIDNSTAANPEDAWVTNGATFSIVAADVSKIEIYEINDEDEEDLSDTAFTYKASEFELDGEDLGLKIGDDIISLGNFRVTITDTGYNAKEMTNAGKYIVKLNGIAGIYAGAEVKIPVTVDPVDLSKVEIEVAGATEAARPAIKIDGVGIEFYGENIATEWNDYVDELGKQSVTLSIAATAGNNYVAGTKSVEYTVVEETVGVGYKYDGEWSSTWNDKRYVEINREEDPDAKFDERDFTNVVAQDADGDVLIDKGWTVVYKKATTDGWVSSSLAEVNDANSYGTFRAWLVLDSENLVIDGEDAAWTYGGISGNYVEIRTSNGDVEDVDVTFKYGKDVVDADDLTGNKALIYTGEDLAKGITFAVETENDADITKDCSLVITKWDDEENDYVAVDSMVDAGSYYVFVASTKYGISATYGISVDVDAAVVNPVLNDELFIGDGTVDAAFLYSGKDVDLVKAFVTMPRGKNDADDLVPMTVPSDAYDVVITSFQAEGSKVAIDDTDDLPATIKAAGTYTVEIVDAKEDADNYDVVAVYGEDFTGEYDEDDEPKFENATSYTVVVTAKDVFTDVAANAWYAEEVYAAAIAGVVQGSNGQFFPNKAAERQDFAIMIYRMLGMNDTDEWAYNDEGTMLPTTEFTDVKTTAYYAWEVETVNDAGIMTGYKGTTEFGVGDKVTREQVATVLHRIDAKGLYKDDTILWADALDAYADADEISGYALPAMKWAVENGIFGVDTAYLNPGDEITRAELAAVLVRYMELREML